MIDEAVPTMRREMLVIDMCLVSPLWGAIVNPCGQICGKACGDVSISPQPCGQSPTETVVGPIRIGLGRTWLEVTKSGLQVRILLFFQGCHAKQRCSGKDNQENDCAE